MPVLVALESSVFGIGNSGNTFIKLAVPVEEPQPLCINRYNMTLLVAWKQKIKKIDHVGYVVFLIQLIVS